jgi:outer membrane protein OmpA-like peptidoglycan-associated protein
MTRRARTCRIAVALVLATGLMSSAVIAGAATTSRFGVADKLQQNAAIAPRFDPAPPTKLDEFAQDPNVRSVHFDFNRATLRPSEVRIVARDARWLKANTPYEVVVEAYADERGTKPYNVSLAKRRAMRVKNELVAHGVRPDRIALVSYGEARPECHDKVRSEACWSKNRRADILVRRASAQNP